MKGGVLYGVVTSAVAEALAMSVFKTELKGGVMTLEEEIDAMCKSNGWEVSVNGYWIAKLVALVRNREQAERERVTAVITDRWAKDSYVKEAIALIYPPKVEMLPVGWYAWRRLGTETMGMFETKKPFEPHPEIDYVPIKNPFEKE